MTWRHVVHAIDDLLEDDNLPVLRLWSCSSITYGDLQEDIVRIEMMDDEEGRRMRTVRAWKKGGAPLHARSRTLIGSSPLYTLRLCVIIKSSSPIVVV